VGGEGNTAGSRKVKRGEGQELSGSGGEGKKASPFIKSVLHSRGASARGKKRAGGEQEHVKKQKVAAE